MYFLHVKYISYSFLAIPDPSDDSDVNDAAAAVSAEQQQMPAASNAKVSDRGKYIHTQAGPVGLCF